MYAINIIFKGLYCYCIAIVLLLHCYCIVILLLLYCYCIVIVLLLHCYGIAIALLLDCYCIVIALLLYFANILYHIYYLEDVQNFLDVKWRKKFKCRKTII